MPIQSVRKITLAVLLVFMVSAGVTWAKEPSQPAPKLVIAETTHSFAPVVDGTLVNHDFVVRNEGEGVLNIHKVKTG
jgi:hypothetical protein